MTPRPWQTAAALFPFVLTASIVYAQSQDASSGTTPPLERATASPPFTRSLNASSPLHRRAAHQPAASGGRCYTRSPGPEGPGC